jgi:hypothetical protein
MGYPSSRSSYAASAPQPTLISVVRERLRLKHYSLRTEQSYVGWIRRLGCAVNVSWWPAFPLRRDADGVGVFGS